MLQLQVDLNFDLLEFKKSLISKSSVFQKMLILKLIRTHTSWELVKVWIFNSSEFQYFKASIPNLSNEWQMSLFIEKFHGLVGLDSFARWACACAWVRLHIELGLKPICLLGLGLDPFAHWAWTKAYLFVRFVAICLLNLNWVLLNKLNYPKSNKKTIIIIIFVVMM